MEEISVWVAREALEDEFSSRIPGIAERPRHAKPLLIVEVVQLVIFKTINGVNATEMRFRIPSCPSTWLFVYVYLRCVSVATASIIL